MSEHYGSVYFIYHTNEQRVWICVPRSELRVAVIDYDDEALGVALINGINASKEGPIEIPIDPRDEGVEGNAVPTKDYKRKTLDAMMDDLVSGFDGDVTWTWLGPDVEEPWKREEKRPR